MSGNYAGGVTSSGIKADNAVIMVGPGALCGVDVCAPDSGTVTVKIYDNATAAAGTVVYESEVLAGLASDHYEWPAINVNNGLYLSVGGTKTGVEIVVRFTRG